jgi:hypothetical protein
MQRFRSNPDSSAFRGCVLVIAALAGGCASVPRENLAVVNNEELAQDYTKLQIRDIAILPPKVMTTEGDRIAAILRDEVKRSLVTRLYSPISFDSIDRKLGPVAERRSFDPAKFKGSFDEDAILAVELTQWDAQWLHTHRKVLVGATFSLYQGEGMKRVWNRELRNRWIEVSGPLTAENAELHEDEAMRRFVKDAMANLPRKAFQLDSGTSSSD